MIALTLNLTWTVLLVSLTVLVTWMCAYRLGRHDGWHSGRRELIRAQARALKDPKAAVGIYDEDTNSILTLRPIPFDQDSA